MMQSHVSLNSVFPYYNNMTAGALDEVILPTLAENRASDHCFDVSVLVEMQGIFSLSDDGRVGQQLRPMNLATGKELLEFTKSFLNASTWAVSIAGSPAGFDMYELFTSCGTFLFLPQVWSWIRTSCSNLTSLRGFFFITSFSGSYWAFNEGIPHCCLISVRLRDWGSFLADDIFDSTSL